MTVPRSALLLVEAAAALVMPSANGHSLRPALGWSSWYAFGASVNQSLMEATFRKLANRSVVAGDDRSLVDVGYVLANLDDGYQACGAGVNGSFHDERGWPIMNNATFPDVGAMTATARALGITPGFYVNNYICGEPTPYGGVGGDTYNRVMSGSVAFLAQYGFGFVKVDSGSVYNDMQLWHDLAAASGADIAIENCHQGGEPPNATWCPFDQWRVGADVNGEGPDYEVLQVAAALPTARAGCRPHPDFMSLNPGDVAGSRALFSLYAVMGTPMIASFDILDDASLLPLWSVLTNADVLAVNQDATAAVGSLLAKFSPHSAADPEFAWAEECDANEPAQRGWAFDAATLLLTWQPPGADAGALCLTSAGLGASLALANCSGAAAQLWRLNGERLWQASPPSARARVGDLALAPCGPPETRPGQQWTFTVGGSQQTNVQSNLSVRMGGCWEITGCDFGNDADLGTTYGCKSLPRPGDTSPCDYNGAFAFNPNGTITSVVSVTLNKRTSARAHTP